MFIWIRRKPKARIKREKVTRVLMMMRRVLIMVRRVLKTCRRSLWTI